MGLATKRDRFAMTVWFKRGHEAIFGTNFLVDLVCRHNPVSPLTLVAAVRKFACDQLVAQVEQLERLLEGRSEEERFMISRAFVCTICRQCGKRDPDGLAGDDEFELHWFCRCCWSRWKARHLP